YGDCGGTSEESSSAGVAQDHTEGFRPLGDHVVENGHENGFGSFPGSEKESAADGRVIEFRAGSVRLHGIVDVGFVCCVRAPTHEQSHFRAGLNDGTSWRVKMKTRIVINYAHGNSVRRTKGTAGAWVA